MKYLHHSLLFLVASFFTLNLSAQTQVQPEISYTSQNPKYELGGLAIDGIKGFDDELLLNISNLEVGKTYEVPGPDISQAIRNYMKQGLFSHASIEADSIVGHKIYLRIKLTAQPRISSLNFEGLKKSEREDIEARIPLKVGNQITPNLVDRTQRRIIKYFEEKGYKNAEVNIVQREDITADNKMLVDVNVKKNDKIRVHRIYITGVEKKEIKSLKNAMKKTNDRTTLKKWFNSKKFQEEKYEEDKGFVIDKLNAWGYRDALIVSDSVVPYDAKHVDVYLNVHKGRKYYIRDIKWVGNTVYPSAALSNILKMGKGDLYNQTLLRKRLSEDADAIGKEYYNNGYVFYRLDPVEVNVEKDSIDLEMRITENRQATYNRIRISGNNRVYDHVIRRELRTKPGDLFSMDALERSLQELAAMNQFDPEVLQSEIGKNIRPDEASGTVDITYPLVTKGADQVELSAGWGPTGITGRASLKFTNFSMQDLFGKSGYKRAGFIPQGDGQTLQLSYQSNGRYFNSFSLSFLEPWFGGKRPNQFSVSAYYSKQSDVSSSYYNNASYNSLLYGYGTNSNYYNYSSYYDPDKYIQLFGVNIGFGKRLRWPDDYFTFMASLGYTRYILKNWEYFLIPNGTSNNINLSLTLARNSTDHPFFPRRGSEMSLSVTATPPYSLFDGKNYEGLATDRTSANYQKEAKEKYRWIEYYKWSMKFKTFIALNNAFKRPPVLMARAEMGILGAYNRYRKSPFETYYMGGSGMSGGYSSNYATETIALRGYEDGSLAGNNLNNAYAYTRMGLELRYPLMLENSTSIYALAFAEGGNAWKDVNKINPFQFKKSVGLGVRILLPMVGMMGIDWAYGFQKYQGTTKIGGSQFHFILGQEF